VLELSTHVSESDPRAPSPPQPSAEPGAGAPPAPQPDEFAHIPSARRRPPLIALGAVALAVFLGIRLRHDVSFALSPARPREVGAASQLASPDAARSLVNRFVTVEGVPERESAVILDTHGSWKFTQLFRLRGTGGRVFVRRQGDPLPVELAERDRFTGRLLRFADLSFSQSIGRHFAARVSATHFFRPADLVAALQSGRTTMADLAGEQVVLQAKDRLFIDVSRPGEYRVELPRERFPDRARAQQRLAATGVQLVKATAPDSRTRWVFQAAVPDADRDRLLSALANVDRGIGLRPARDTLEVAVADLAAAPGGGLTVTRAGAPPEVLAGPLLASVRTRAPVQIPADALILLEGEAPRQSWKALLILAFLASFAVVNLLGLRRPA
jgi:hypothetical protein